MVNVFRRKIVVIINTTVGIVVMSVIVVSKLIAHLNRTIGRLKLEDCVDEEVNRNVACVFFLMKISKNRDHFLIAIIIKKSKVQFVIIIGTYPEVFALSFSLRKKLNLNYST